MLNLLFIICILLIFLFINNPEYFITAPVRASDNNSYRVIKSFDDYNEASNVMSKINKFIVKMLKHLKNKFVINKNGMPNEIAFVQRLLKNYNPDSVFENLPIFGGNTSFVVNKGASFGICLRNKQNYGMHDFALIKFVILHEMTHMGTIMYGHDYEFWSWFKFMTVEAHKAGIYKPINYANGNVNYCGLNITFNPFYSTYDWQDSKANP